MANEQLKQHLKQLKYKHVDLAIRDALPVMNSYKTLLVGKENNTLPMTNGAKDYVVLNGTIPVFYKGASYNIPICMFLLETHPYNPPVVFVRPTPDMVIAESRHVDRQGRVYLPYLAEWKHPASDLSGLIQVMSIVFADNMPVYSRPGGPPPPPVQPPSGLPYPWPNQPQQSAQPTPYPNPPQPFYPQPPAQPPRYPLNTQPSGNNLPYPVGPGAAPVPQPSPASAWNATPQVQQPQMNSLSAEEIKASLVSAVEDRLRRKYREEHDQLSTEIASLRQTNSELVSGRNQIQKILQNIETEKKDVITRTQAIEEKRKEVDAALTRLRSTKMPPIDEVVTAPYPLYRQLLEAHAEDLAVEDAIYHLGEALGREKISVDVYLKKVRELSVRQFTIRAIVDKCRLVAGLPPITASSHAL